MARMIDGFALAKARIRTHRTILAEGFRPEQGFVAWLTSSDHAEPRQRNLHDLFEVSVVLSGRVHAYAEGQHMPLVRGDVWLTPPWELHEWEVPVPHTQSLVIFLMPYFIGTETLDGRPLIDLFAAPAHQRPHASTSRKRQLAMAIAEDLVQEMTTKERNWVTGVRLGVMRLLFVIGRDWESAGRGTPSHSLRTSRLAQIAPAVKLLEQLPPERVLLKEAAKACSLSVAHFSHLFKLTMGLSYGRFALRSRLTRAAKLLLTTSLASSGIAQELGFAHASHLHRAFRAVYGCTPMKFRAMGGWEPLDQDQPASPASTG
ncbi:MAG: AraC family transcriptional regulator [Armatimonadota bacterium]|jgi:AraC-like DNA-binding protein